MKRRSFFAAVSAFFASILGVGSAKALTTKEDLIAQALQTPEGKAALANAMAQPIRCGGKDYRQFAKVANFAPARIDYVRIENYLEMAKDNPAAARCLANLQERRRKGLL